MKDRNDRRRLIGVALGAKTMSEALDALPNIAAEAEVVEYRLDYFEEPYDLRRLLRERPIPVIVTNRPPREGGRCDQSDPERLRVLQSAAELGAEYIDIEWDAVSPAALASLKANGSQVIVSRHSFEAMPIDFLDWVDFAADSGADVVKTVGMARGLRDTLPVFAAFQRSSKPMISIAMGEAGLISRILALRYDNCLLTFATLGRGESTAPGQLPVRALHEVYRAKQIGANTAVFGYLATTSPPTERLSALNAATRDAGVDGVWVPFVTDDRANGSSAEIVQAFRAVGVAGYLVDESAQASITEAAEIEPSMTAADQGGFHVLREVAGRMVSASAKTLDEAFTLVVGQHPISDSILTTRES